jgi:acyl dehydratase
MSTEAYMSAPEPMQYIENKTYDEIAVGDHAHLTRTLKPQDIELFAVMSGDVNPAHVDAEYAKTDQFHRVIAHGMWGGALISAVLGTELPGPGTIFLNQSLTFEAPVGLGDMVTVRVEVTEKFEKGRVLLACTCLNQDGETVIEGVARVIAPRDKVRRPRVVLPKVYLHVQGAQYARLIAATEDLKPVRTAVGLRIERRMSHIYVLDVPTYPKTLLITDAAINIYPDLAIKRDIVQNAIDLAFALGTPLPKVAILSAVETVNPRITSTLDAAALCKMADRGQIIGGLLDGPLAFDNAISPVAVAAKGIVSDVAGIADILVAPDLEAANMIAKQLIYLAGADAAGIVLGARVPIILTSRADSSVSRLASCALAQLFINHQPSTLP